MRSRWWYLLGLAAVPLSLAFSTQVANADSHAQINFDDIGRVVTLTIPTPPCRPDHQSIACTWELFVNEPDVPGQPVVGEVYGTSGVLSVNYPAFCGVIQADAIVRTSATIRGGLPTPDRELWLSVVGPPGRTDLGGHPASDGRYRRSRPTGAVPRTGGGGRRARQTEEGVRGTSCR